MTPKTRKKLEALVWKHTHEDFRGTLGDEKTVLTLRGGQGTCLVTLDGLTEVELLSKLPRKLLTLVSDVNRACGYGSIKNWSIEDVSFYEVTNPISHTKIFLTAEEAKAA